MAESSTRLHHIVAAEVRLQRQLSTTRQKTSPAKMMGLFIEVCLRNRSYTRKQFARALRVEQELAEAILDGFLPASELDDDLLVEIAQVLKHHPNTLRIILGREIVPTKVSELPPNQRPPAESNGADTARSSG